MSAEDRQALIDELEEEYALDNIQAPAGAASNWTEDEIRECVDCSPTPHHSEREREHQGA